LARFNDGAWTDAIGALHANSYTCRDDAPRTRSSVAVRYTVVAPSAVPTVPAQAGRGQAIGHLLVMSQARPCRWQTWQRVLWDGSWDVLFSRLTKSRIPSKHSRARICSGTRASVAAATTAPRARCHASRASSGRGEEEPL